MGSGGGSSASEISLSVRHNGVTPDEHRRLNDISRIKNQQA